MNEAAIDNPEVLKPAEQDPPSEAEKGATPEELALYFGTPWRDGERNGASTANGSVEDDSQELKQRLANIQAAQNPLLEAAQPLLRALADMPTQLETQSDGIEALRSLLIREVQTFQTLCDQASLRREHILAVRYCLCTALDEAANKSVWGGGGAWASKSLLITFHNESYGGEKLFLLIGRLSPNPQEYGDVLEVIYRILGLGFEGRYSVRTDGRKQLDQIRQQVLSVISNRRDAVARDLSAHWQAEASGKLRLFRAIPVWMSATLLLCLLLAIYSWYKYHAVDADTELQRRITAIGKMAPPPAMPQILRLKILLKDEIARGVVSVDENAQQSKVTFLGDFMFVPGQKSVNAKMIPVLEKVAGEVNKVKGRVLITGHTDNQPIHTTEFPSNQVLSEKRAAEVAALLTTKGVAAARLKTEGKGDTEPVNDNTTADGRAKNRRVDIVVME